MSKNTKKKSTFSLMLRRLFIGGREEHTVENERYDSPTKLAVKRFFRKPLACIAVFVLLSLFAVVFFGPLINPIDLSYNEPLHTNVAPTMSLMKLPSSMKNGTVSITSRGAYTMGLDTAGDVHMWGYYSTFFSDPAKNVMNVPEEVKNSNIVFAAAGFDHCLAIADDGTVYGWGEYTHGQYGNHGRLADLCKLKMPEEFITGKIDVDNVEQLVCGKQVSAIVMKDGTVHLWGNTMSNCHNAESILKDLKSEDLKAKKLVFTNSDAFVLTTDGTILFGKNKQYEMYRGENTLEIIGDRKVVDIAATSEQLAILLDDNTVMTLGSEKAEPDMDGDKIVSLSGGTRHFVLTTESGKTHAWGNGKLGQTNVPSALTKEGAVDTVIASGFQNYAFKDGKHVDSWGLKGYLFGTDDLGRDVFNRVVNGGKMTMTIGAVAVIVSTIIGVIVGCISGYFGGWVDLILMRVTEIFAAIPFLPFALVLSAALQSSNLTEDTRIFIIMVILGLLTWTGLARLVRGQVLAEREKEFVLAAQSMGVRERRIAFKHILPNIISVILVSVTLDFATCMLTESSLSYLGFGVQLPRPTWGNMLDGCRDATVIQNFWWRWLFPALFLSLAVICINVIGDTLRDVLDPKSEVEK